MGRKPTSTEPNGKPVSVRLMPETLAGLEAKFRKGDNANNVRAAIDQALERVRAPAGMQIGPVPTPAGSRLKTPAKGKRT